MSTKKYKKLLSLGLAFCFMVLSISNGVIVRAAEKITVNNECVLLPEKQVSEICEAVVENITEKYAGVYSFENIDVTIYNEQEEVENIVVDVEVLTDMILIRNPQDSPYVQGMKAEIQTMTDTEEKAAAVFAMNSYLQNANKYYNVPILTGFCYRIYVPKVTTMSDFASAEYNIYHRVDTEDGAILTEVQENERITEIKDVEDGKQYINNALAETEAAALRAVSYNESDAVDYAVAHARIYLNIVRLTETGVIVQISCLNA